jgi:hypothetical protein
MLLSLPRVADAGLIAWEAAAYAVMRRQRRAALAEIRGVGLAHADGMKQAHPDMP